MKTAPYLQVTSVPGSKGMAVVVKLHLDSVRKVVAFARDISRHRPGWIRPVFFAWLLAWGFRKLLSR